MHLWSTFSSVVWKYIGILMYVIHYFYVTVTDAAPKCPRAESPASSWPCAELSRRRVGGAESAAPSCPIPVVLTDSDTPPPSQNRPKPVRRPPVMVDVGMQVSPVSATEPPTSSAVSVSEGPMLGLATDVPLPRSPSHP